MAETLAMPFTELPTAPGQILSLAGRTIIVTGAAQGIGQAVAQLSHNLGASVVAVDMNGDALAAWAKSLGGDRVMTAVGSVGEEGFAEQVVADAVARFGDVDGLVNNAGISRAAMIEKMTAQQWQDVMNINLTGAFYFLQAAGRHMIAQVKAGKPSRASIVNISSDGGRRGSIGQINYSSAKSGMFGLTMSAAREWAKHGIRVNSVAFGVVETPMTETIRGDKFRDGMLDMIPMKRFSNTAEVVPPICFLLSDGASYITGQNLSVNGGYTISL
jgi:3-oxoacyl-[acyl-carrier protein] reductase